MSEAEGQGQRRVKLQVDFYQFMKSVYLKLFRCELRRLEKKGGFRAVERYITTCEAYFQKREYQLVALLEKARLDFLMGRWEDCLALLDQVGSEESLLEPDDKALLYLVIC